MWRGCRAVLTPTWGCTPFTSTRGESAESESAWNEPAGSDGVRCREFEIAQQKHDL